MSLIAPLLALAVTVTTASAQDKPLFLNGSFEDPFLGEGTYQKIVNWSNIGPWVVIGTLGNVDLIEEKWCEYYTAIDCPAKAGRQWVDLTGTSYTRTGVRHGAALDAGTRYRLSFYIGHLYDGGVFFGSKSAVIVRIRTVPEGGYFFRREFVHRCSSTCRDTIAWKKFSVDFVARNGIHQFEFLNGDLRSDDPDKKDDLNGLDRVTITEIP